MLSSLLDTLRVRLTLSFRVRDPGILKPRFV